MATIGIVGGGIAGLTAAYTLKQQGLDVRLFEARDRSGGVIQSERDQGFLIEMGPNALQTSTPLLKKLIRELDLIDDVVPASSSAQKRYIVLGNTPVAVPTTPLEVLSTPLLSPKAKIRLLAEPLIRKSDTEEESVADFVKRRLGKEVLDYGINPFVAGIFAGDPQNLSLPYTFPRLHELEQNYGSLIIGQIRSHLAKPREKKKTTDDSNGTPPAIKGLFTFKEGLQQLTDALASQLEGDISLNSPVRSLEQSDDGWRITYGSGESRKTVNVDAVVYAAPLYALSKLNFSSPVDYSPLMDVSYPPVTLVAMGFKKKNVTHPLDGFGMLVPAIEDHLRILGTLFPSSIFPNRAPKDHHLLTTFVGGARNPDVAQEPEDDLVRIVCQDLTRLLGIKGFPEYTRCVRWENAIPQYAIGYGRVMSLLRELEEAHEGLRFAGNYRQGVSVGAACGSGYAAARALTKQLNESDELSKTPTSGA